MPISVIVFVRYHKKTVNVCETVTQNMENLTILKQFSKLQKWKF